MQFRNQPRTLSEEEVMTVMDFKVHEQVPITDDKVESSGTKNVLRTSLRHLIREAYALMELPKESSSDS